MQEAFTMVLVALETMDPAISRLGGTSSPSRAQVLLKARQEWAAEMDQRVYLSVWSRVAVWMKTVMTTMLRTRTRWPLAAEFWICWEVTPRVAMAPRREEKVSWHEEGRKLEAVGKEEEAGQ
jgi:hypothetical protein